MTAETANLVRTLDGRRRGGRAVRVQPAVDPGRRRGRAGRADGAEVHAVRGEDATAYAGARRRASSARAPQITLDDGADLVGAAARRAADAARRASSAAPRRRRPASCGCARWRPRAGCACPVIAVNEARTERAFNDRYGTGQSTLDGILRATNLLLAGRTRRRARLRLDGPRRRACARAAPARTVIVCEVDPLRALEARMEGFEVMPALGGRRARRRLHHRHRRAATCCGARALRAR